MYVSVQLIQTNACLSRWVLQQPLVASAVVGASTCSQLAELLEAAGKPPLPEDVVAQIDAIHEAHPNPTP